MLCGFYFKKKKFNIALLEPPRLINRVANCQVTELFHQHHTADGSVPSKCWQAPGRSDVWS